MTEYHIILLHEVVLGVVFVSCSFDILAMLHDVLPIGFDIGLHQGSANLHEDIVASLKDRETLSHED